MAEYKRINTFQALTEVLADGEQYDFIIKKDSEISTTRMWLDEDEDGKPVYVVSPDEMIVWECDVPVLKKELFFKHDAGKLFVKVDTDENSESGEDTFIGEDEPTQSEWWRPEKATGDYIIPDGVTHIAPYAFNGCADLTSVTMPDSVIEVGEGAFEDCKNLVSVVLSKNLTYIPDSMCYNNIRLLSIHLPNSITQIQDHAFSGCRSLEKVNIPNKVEKIGQRAFMGCAALTTLRLPESVRHIGENAFSACWKLAITIPSHLRWVNSSFTGLVSCKKVKLE